MKNEQRLWTFIATMTEVDDLCSTWYGTDCYWSRLTDVDSRYQLRRLRVQVSKLVFAFFRSSCVAKGRLRGPSPPITHTKHIIRSKTPLNLPIWSVCSRKHS